MTEDEKQQVAVFRFGVISDFVNGSQLNGAQRRQLLADKISGNKVATWLLIPEHLRLGTWDLLCGWTGKPGASLEPRLALQMVHEAALSVTGIRQQRTLSQKGFEVANGLPYVGADQAIHSLLNAHCIAEAQQLQTALGKIRQASGHFPARLYPNTLIRPVTANLRRSA